jgi:rhodanese-related sulfurtransferase
MRIRFHAAPLLACLALLGAIALALDAGANAAEELSNRDAFALVETGNSPLFVDVRTRQEYTSGHVPGAVNIPRDQLAGRLSELESARDRLVVYCERGPRAAAAKATLEGAGFTGVRRLSGDMSGWRAAGLPIEK